MGEGEDRKREGITEIHRTLRPGFRRSRTHTVKGNRHKTPFRMKLQACNLWENGHDQMEAALPGALSLIPRLNPWVPLLWFIIQTLVVFLRVL